MNALERYFSETGENANKLADRIGCAPSTITRPLKGERNVSMDVALDVERATGGRVSAEDFLSICLAAKRAVKVEGPERVARAGSELRQHEGETSDAHRGEFADPINCFDEVGFNEGQPR